MHNWFHNHLFTLFCYHFKKNPSPLLMGKPSISKIEYSISWELRNYIKYLIRRHALHRGIYCSSSLWKAISVKCMIWYLMTNTFSQVWMMLWDPSTIFSLNNSVFIQQICAIEMRKKRRHLEGVNDISSCEKMKRVLCCLYEC